MATLVRDVAELRKAVAVSEQALRQERAARAAERLRAEQARARLSAGQKEAQAEAAGLRAKLVHTHALARVYQHQVRALKEHLAQAAQQEERALASRASSGSVALVVQAGAGGRVASSLQASPLTPAIPPVALPPAEEGDAVARELDADAAHDVGTGLALVADGALEVADEVSPSMSEKAACEAALAKVVAQHTVEADAREVECSAAADAHAGAVYEAQGLASEAQDGCEFVVAAEATSAAEAVATAPPPARHLSASPSAPAGPLPGVREGEPLVSVRRTLDQEMGRAEAPLPAEEMPERVPAPSMASPAPLPPLPPLIDPSGGFIPAGGGALLDVALDAPQPKGKPPSQPLHAHAVWRPPRHSSNPRLQHPRDAVSGIFPDDTLVRYDPVTGVAGTFVYCEGGPTGRTKAEVINVSNPAATLAAPRAASAHRVAPVLTAERAEQPGGAGGSGSDGGGFAPQPTLPPTSNAAQGATAAAVDGVHALIEALARAGGECERGELLHRRDSASAVLADATENDDNGSHAATATNGVAAPEAPARPRSRSGSSSVRFDETPHVVCAVDGASGGGVLQETDMYDILVALGEIDE